MCQPARREPFSGSQLHTPRFCANYTRDAQRLRIVRVQSIPAGNFGDCKPLEGGVWELRIDWGPGYRVYCALAGRRVVLLLVGCDKRRQRADIAAALKYWQDWQRRNAP